MIEKLILMHEIPYILFFSFFETFRRGGRPLPPYGAAPDIHRYPKYFVTFVHYWRLETK